MCFHKEILILKIDLDINNFCSFSFKAHQSPQSTINVSWLTLKGVIFLVTTSISSQNTILANIRIYLPLYL